MLACQLVLTLLQGWTALLRGGIIGCIAKEFLSIDGVLDGPSVEVTVHQVGYIALSGNDNTRFCDNQLTDNEITIICGTYLLYTGEFIYFFIFILYLIFFHRFRSSCCLVVVSHASSLGIRLLQLQLAYLDRAI